MVVRLCQIRLWRQFTFIWCVSALSRLTPLLFPQVYIHQYAFLNKSMDNCKVVWHSPPTTACWQVQEWCRLYFLLEADCKMRTSRNKRWISEWRNPPCGRSFKVLFQSICAPLPFRGPTGSQSFVVNNHTTKPTAALPKELKISCDVPKESQHESWQDIKVVRSNVDALYQVGIWSRCQ